MMRIEIENLLLPGQENELSLVWEADPAAVVNSQENELLKEIFNCLAGLREPSSGKILIDGTDHLELISQSPLPKVFGYVMDRGIMLSNLSLRENLLLPYRIIKEDAAEDRFDLELQDWLDQFELSIDLQLRPAFVSPSQIKLLAIIRVLLYKPKLLILDDPYYLLSQAQRDIAYKVLSSLKTKHLMLISSQDDDFLLRFGAKVYTL